LKEEFKLIPSFQPQPWKQFQWSWRLNDYFKTHVCQHGCSWFKNKKEKLRKTINNKFRPPYPNCLIMGHNTWWLGEPWPLRWDLQRPIWNHAHIKSK
jgi:hypothetical protein